MRRWAKGLGAAVVLGVLAAAAAPAKTPSGGTERVRASWHRIIDPGSRFRTVMGGEAVLDRETRLVWERTPVTAAVRWVDASFLCYAKTVGGRKGWRLPTVEEISSLIDPAQHGPALPPGHPFSDVQNDVYWSATTIAGFAANAWGVSMDDGTLFDDLKSAGFRFWCVRGGHGHDGI